MAKVVSFTANPFQENTFIIYDDTKECIIIDPGCFTNPEKEELTNFITTQGLTPVRLINTHSHIDHIFGNNYVHTTYNLLPELHKDEEKGLELATQVGLMYGLPFEKSPSPKQYINEGDVIRFGNTELLTLFTPGHSIASLSFYCEADGFVIGGDVLFNGSIGRTDLPGGDYDTLINSIKTQLLPLGDDTTVYCGHGPSTTIGKERISNPFLI